MGKMLVVDIMIKSTIFPGKEAYIQRTPSIISTINSDSLLAGKYQDKQFEPIFQFYIDRELQGLNIQTAKLKLYLRPDKQRHPLPSELKVYALKVYFWKYVKNPETLNAPVSSLVVPPEVDRWVSWDVTELVKDWFADEITNYGVVIKTNPMDPPGAAAFYSTRSLTEFTPRLIVMGFQDCCCPSDDHCWPFINKREEYIVHPEVGYSQYHDITALNYVSFVAKNDGDVAIAVQTQVAPGMDEFMDEPPEFILEPGSRRIMVPKYFTRYARVKFRSLGSGLNGRLIIWFQAR